MPLNNTFIIDFSRSNIDPLRGGGLKLVVMLVVDEQNNFSINTEFLTRSKRFSGPSLSAATKDSFKQLFARAINIVLRAKHYRLNIEQLQQLNNFIADKIEAAMITVKHEGNLAPGVLSDFLIFCQQSLIQTLRNDKMRPATNTAAMSGSGSRQGTLTARENKQSRAPAIAMADISFSTPAASLIRFNKLRYTGYGYELSFKLIDGFSITFNFERLDSYGESADFVLQNTVHTIRLSHKNGRKREREFFEKGVYDATCLDNLLAVIPQLRNNHELTTRLRYELGQALFDQLLDSRFLFPEQPPNRREIMTEIREDFDNTHRHDIGLLLQLLCDPKMTSRLYLKQNATLGAQTDSVSPPPYTASAGAASSELAPPPYTPHSSANPSSAASCCQPNAPALDQTHCFFRPKPSAPVLSVDSAVTFSIKPGKQM